MTVLCFYFQYNNVFAQYIIISFLNISLLGNEPTETHTNNNFILFFTSNKVNYKRGCNIKDHAF